jgi:SAM-dependent methyltransferase
MTETRLPTPAELYEQFYGPAIFGPLAEILVEYAAPRDGERVLDLACGTGLVARRVAPLLGRYGKVLAVDISPAMLEVARSLPAPEGAPIEWREADAIELELHHGELDLAFCQQSLQLFSNPVGVLERVRHGLAEGGRLALAAWQGIEFQSLLADFAEAEARHLGPLGVTFDDIIAPYSLGDPEELRSLLEQAGFAEIDIVYRPFEARFDSPASFARNLETAYGAVIPAFVEDPSAFEAFVEAVERDTRAAVRRYTVGNEVRFPMPTNLALAAA